MLFTKEAISMMILGPLKDFTYCIGSLAPKNSNIPAVQLPCHIEIYLVMMFNSNSMNTTV